MPTVSTVKCKAKPLIRNPAPPGGIHGLVQLPARRKRPYKLGGVPILKGTRMQADSIVEDYVWGSPIEEIADNFDIPKETIRLVLEYAQAKQRTAVQA